MDRFIQELTDRLLDKLPDEAEYYQPTTLAASGIPHFIIDRIRQELKRNLAESIILPDTDWANMQSKAVQTAWKQFVQAIRDEARLPASFARTVMETAVADVLELLVLPRASVVDYLYGADKSLDLETLYERCSGLMVYRHFAAVLPRYMERKQLEALDKERAQLVIQKVDEKLTARYSALNWAQMLEPLFELFEGQVDPELLRQFFLDRDMPNVAEAFDRKDKTIRKADVIELLSDPEVLLHDEQEAMREASVTSAESAKRQSTASSQTETEPTQQQESEDSETAAEDSESPTSDHVSSPIEPDQQTAGRSSLALEVEQTEEEDAEDVPIWKQFAGDETEEEPEEEEDASDTLAAQFVAPDQEKAEKSGNEQSESTHTNEHGEKVDEDGFIDEPIIDLTQADEEPSGDSNKQRLKEIHSHLEDNRDYFVNELFDGDEVAFDETLEEIVQFKSWRAASKFINSEVFRRNLIDLYSEPAVDFTDRLHTYFLEDKSD
ncbi:MAG: hypothetical protein ACQETE_01165 [Bacteroidota bacterium]